MNLQIFETMKNKVIIILCFLPLILISQSNCKVTYIANEGFFIESQQKKIIIDGLFDKIDGDWCDSPSEEILRKIKSAEAPFDDIDLIAVTHYHRDHFNEEVVLQHLLNNKKGILLCPEQVYLVLKEEKEFKRVKERVISITPPLYSDSTIKVSGINIRVLRLEHSHYEKVNSETGAVYNKHQNVENLGYVIEIVDTKLFHCGDTNPKNQKEYQTFQLQKEGIDIAFLERQFVSVYGNECLNKIEEFIKPEYIFLMHIKPSNQEYFSDVFKDLPHVFVSQQKMDSFELTINPKLLKR